MVVVAGEAVLKQAEGQKQCLYSRTTSGLERCHTMWACLSMAAMGTSIMLLPSEVLESLVPAQGAGESHKDGQGGEG